MSCIIFKPSSHFLETHSQESGCDMRTWKCIEATVRTIFRWIIRLQWVTREEEKGESEPKLILCKFDKYFSEILNLISSIKIVQFFRFSSNNATQHKTIEFLMNIGDKSRAEPCRAVLPTQHLMHFCVIAVGTKMLWCQLIKKFLNNYLPIFIMRCRTVGVCKYSIWVWGRVYRIVSAKGARVRVKICFCVEAKTIFYEASQVDEA